MLFIYLQEQIGPQATTLTRFGVIYLTPLSKSLLQKKIPGNEHLGSGPIFEGVFLLLQTLSRRTLLQHIFVFYSQD